MMKKLFTVAAIGLTLLTCHTSCTQQQKAQEAFAPIKVETPARPAGQEDVIQLVAPKIDTVRVGFIGLGMRGPGAVSRWTHIPGTKIVGNPEECRNAGSYFLQWFGRRMEETMRTGRYRPCIYSN